MLRHESQKQSPQRIIAIIGPTASGKSALAVRLARRFGGEVVSADSRQVYRGLDIGTNKVTAREMRGVPHHLIDIASPRQQFTAHRYRTHAEKVIASIVGRGKIPIICGGTGFYIDALLGRRAIAQVPRDTTLRRRLERQGTDDLFALLTHLDPTRAASIDPHNPRRLVRAIEIAVFDASTSRQSHGGGITRQPSRGRQGVTHDEKSTVLIIGLSPDPRALRDKIRTRLRARLAGGMVAEVTKLHKNGLSWKRLDALGLEYRYVAKYLCGELSRAELETTLEHKIWQYAKRQRTWFRRNPDIVWFPPDNVMAIERAVALFLAAAPEFS